LKKALAGDDQSVEADAKLAITGWMIRLDTEGTVEVLCTEIAPLEGQPYGEASLGKSREMSVPKDARKLQGGRETGRPTPPDRTGCRRERRWQNRRSSLLE